jgi:hypothetical protein
MLVMIYPATLYLIMPLPVSVVKPLSAQCAHSSMEEPIHELRIYPTVTALRPAPPRGILWILVDPLPIFFIISLGYAVDDLVDSTIFDMLAVRAVYVALMNLTQFHCRGADSL